MHEAATGAAGRGLGCLSVVLAGSAPAMDRAESKLQRAPTWGSIYHTPGCQNAGAFPSRILPFSPRPGISPLWHQSRPLPLIASPAFWSHLTHPTPCLQELRVQHGDVSHLAPECNFVSPPSQSRVIPPGLILTYPLVCRSSKCSMET